MPYIKPEIRDRINGVIDTCIDEIHEVVEPENMLGVANYTVTRIVLGLVKQYEPRWRYANLAQVIATLEAAKLEIYRRLVGPYEDEVIKKNGDLEEFIGEVPAKGKENACFCTQYGCGV